MAYGEITIKDPSVTGALPDLVLRNFGANGHRRSISPESLVQLTEFTEAGNPVFTGPNILNGYRFVWTLTADIPRYDALHLEALILKQNTQLKTSNFKLTLIDEIEYVPPELAASKTLVPGSSITAPIGVYGYGQFSVKLQLASDDQRTHLGWGQIAKQDYKRVQFTAIEVPT